MDEKAETPIQNCDNLVKNRCPKKWINLQRTEYEDVGFCTSCQKKVFFCYTLEQTYRHRGDCIVVMKGARNYSKMHPVMKWLLRDNPIARTYRLWRALVNGKIG